MDSTKVAQPEELSQYYLKNHKICELLENITSGLVYYRPDDPKSFIVDFVKKLIASRGAKVDYPSLFDDSNIRSLFEIMDPAHKGYINHSQYKSGMSNLGVHSYERNPPGSEEDKIEIESFVSEAREGLSLAAATFSS